MRIRADLSALIRITLRNYPSPSVGAREDDVGLGGPSWSPVGMGCAARSSRSQQGRGPRSHPRRVTMKVTPTDHPASCLSSWLRLMPIQVDKSAPTDVRIILLHASSTLFATSVISNCLIVAS